MTGNRLTSNGGSSSIKFALYTPVAPARHLLGGRVEAPRGKES
jgi:hypothetical protein